VLCDLVFQESEDLELWMILPVHSLVVLDVAGAPSDAPAEELLPASTGPLPSDLCTET